MLVSRLGMPFSRSGSPRQDIRQPDTRRLGLTVHSCCKLSDWLLRSCNLVRCFGLFLVKFSERGFSACLRQMALQSFPLMQQEALDLGSLRAGGATWWLQVSEDRELTRRRGRWLTTRVMEIYVQELNAVKFLPKLPCRVREMIVLGAALFPWCLHKAFRMHASSCRACECLVPSFSK